MRLISLRWIPTRVAALMKFIKLLCFADVHSPRYLSLFIASMARADTSQVSAVLMAGDIVERGRVEALRHVLTVLRKHVGIEVPLYAVFGNEEYFDKEHEFVNMYPEIRWLNDEVAELRVEGATICIVGSRGVLAKPTHWQSKHIPNIHSLYRNRIRKLRELLQQCRSSCTKVVLLTHYASSLATIKGEPPSIHSYLGYPIIEGLPPGARPDLAIHGHAHNSKVLRAVVNGVEVHNVALPARKSVTLINVALEPRPQMRS